MGWSNKATHSEMTSFGHPQPASFSSWPSRSARATTCQREPQWPQGRPQRFQCQSPAQRGQPCLGHHHQQIQIRIGSGLAPSHLRWLPARDLERRWSGASGARSNRYSRSDSRGLSWWASWRRSTAHAGMQSNRFLPFVPQLKRVHRRCATAGGPLTPSVAGRA